MATPKLTNDKLRFYVQHEVMTPAQLARMFVLDLTEVEYRIAKMRHDDKRKGREPGLTPQEEAKQRRVDVALAQAGKRPLPPESLVDDPNIQFAPAPDLRDWLIATFIADGAPLYNEVHQHLLHANLGLLWTNVENSRNGKRVVGQAEFPRGQGGKWSKARADYQLQHWFGDVPTFLITLDAVYACSCDDWQFCAICEHELLHCGQATDEFGLPRFNEETGMPVYTSRAHDIEEFDDIVFRYGLDATQRRRFVEAALSGPYFGEAQIAGACGTCLKKT